MLIEILIILLIIIVLFVFLLFFKTWHLHILFKNNNFDYDLLLDITFLFIQITLNKITSDTIISVSLNLFSNIKQLFSINLNSIKTSKTDEETNDDNDENNDKNKEVFIKIKEICPILLESKEELIQIIQHVIQIIKFNKSILEVCVGLGDNNLTIKLCNLIWALSAPLYPLKFQLILIPQINETIIKSNGDIRFDIKLFNILKIIFIIIKNSKLHDLIRIIRD